MIDGFDFALHTPNNRARLSISTPDLLHIQAGNRLSYGAQQTWYASWRQRLSGCGPTAASNLLWYLCATRPDTCGALVRGDGRRQADMVGLMNEVWKDITPGCQGVNKASIFMDGGLRYGNRYGVRLKARTLEVPMLSPQRPTPGELLHFLSEAFADDLPVAFLNLSNGALHQLDSWHWVTLVAVDNALCAEMYDEGRSQVLDLTLWLRSTTGGGAFVALEPA